MLSQRQEIDVVFIINANEYHVSFRSLARISTVLLSPTRSRDAGDQCNRMP
jgi:hypothetical protein